MQEPPAELKTWRPDYSKASWTPPGDSPPSRCLRRQIVILCFAVIAAILLTVAAVMGWFKQRESPVTSPLQPPIPPPVPAPRAHIASANPGVVTVTWEAVGGAVGYLLQEWNWNRLDDRGWYSVRAVDGDEGEFVFQFGYGGIELPRCGTVIPVPHATLQVAGRAGLRLEWRVRSVGHAGTLSAWSPATNAVNMPRWQGEQVDNNCEQCSAGNHDDDKDAETLCKPCSPGTYAGIGSVNCTACLPGWADLDSNPSTPCELCPPGSASRGTRCALCEPGYSDHDRDPATGCTPCPAGSHSPGNTTTCTQCPPGRRDWDANPGTACTACPSCGPGECPVGTHMTTSADADSTILCTPCRGGLVDHDADPRTECQVCNAGTESSSMQFGSVSCALCARGKTDRDSNASTACSTCLPGRYSDTEGTVGNCTSCALDKTSESGATTVDDCYHIGLAPSVRTALVGVAAAAALGLAAAVLVFVARAVVSLTSNAQRWWHYRRTHRMKVHNYDEGEGTPVVVSQPSSWLQDVLWLMKRVDSTVHQAAITEEVPQHPRPSAAPISRGCNADVELLDRGKKSQVCRVLAHWEAQYSGAITGTARESVALAVAAKRKKTRRSGQDSNAVVKDLRSEGVLSYAGHKPGLPQLTAAQQDQQIFKCALKQSRSAMGWRPSPKPLAAISDDRTQTCTTPPELTLASKVKRSNQLPPLVDAGALRFKALEKAVLSERLAGLKNHERLETEETVQSSQTLAADAAEWLDSLGLQHWSSRLAQLGTTLEDLVLLQDRDVEVLGFERTELNRFTSALNQLQLQIGASKT